jgi:hypothetical protein
MCQIPYYEFYIYAPSSFFSYETGSHYVVQADLEPLGLSSSPVSACRVAGAIDMGHCAWLHRFSLILTSAL